jgi:hypothetical protein
LRDFQLKCSDLFAVVEFESSKLEKSSTLTAAVDGILDYVSKVPLWFYLSTLVPLLLTLSILAGSVWMGYNSSIIDGTTSRSSNNYDLDDHGGFPYLN